MKVGVAKETAPGERRVALVPEALGKLKAAGLDVLVERDAGAGASIPDSAYQEAGATVDLPTQFEERAVYVAEGEMEAAGLRHGPGQMLVFAAGAPCANASTVPSLRLRTQPATPSSIAACTAAWR